LFESDLFIAGDPPLVELIYIQANGIVTPYVEPEIKQQAHGVLSAAF
jgi:hypothetical protein